MKNNKKKEQKQKQKIKNPGIDYKQEQQFYSKFQNLCLNENNIP